MPHSRHSEKKAVEEASLCRRRRNVQFLPQLEKIRCRPTGQMLAAKWHWFDTKVGRHAHSQDFSLKQHQRWRPNAALAFANHAMVLRRSWRDTCLITLVRREHPPEMLRVPCLGMCPYTPQHPRPTLGWALLKYSTGASPPHWWWAHPVVHNNNTRGRPPCGPAGSPAHIPGRPSVLARQ